MSQNTTPEPTDAAPPQHAQPRRRRRSLWLALALVPVLIGGGAVAAQAHKTVELEVDGETRTVTTWAGSVDGLLRDQGIDVGEHDLLAPGADAALDEGAEIVVRSAQQVSVQVDGEQRQVWTTAMSQADLVSSLHESGREVTLSASRSLDRSALELPLVVDGEALVRADGEETRVELEGEATVRDALEQAEVEVGRSDHVRVSSAADGTPVVSVTRVERDRRTETERIDFDTVRQADDSMYEGETRVVQEGRPGERTRTFGIIEVGGEQRTNVLLSNEVTREPVDRIIAYGTAERPAPEPEPEPEPAPSSGGGSSSSGGSSGSSSGGSSDSSDSAEAGGSSVPSDVWSQLAQCESGGDPTTNTGNGYYGMYQFTLSTWQSVGGSGLPSEASAAEQTMRAQILQQRAGWGQWPHCAAQLGLL